MTEKKDNNGWATFGKATAWIVGLGAIGTGLYFGGNALYNAGYDSAKRDLTYALRDESGMQIPGTCFTLAEVVSSSPAQYVLSAKGNCSGLEITIPHESDYARTQKSVELVLGNTKTTVQNQSPYATVQHWNAGWQ